MATKCLNSSLPDDFSEQLQVYTEQGFRVIALAYKQLNFSSNEEVQSALRDSVEGDLHFLGFLVMENKLKAVTSQSIKTLNDCNIRTMMATGDNLLTAICVARNCNILRGD
jgi:cation-transporting ATPase 13A3/4/5